jgi:crossover junction endodeoxyribonuclease RuvC
MEGEARQRSAAGQGPVLLVLGIDPGTNVTGYGVVARQGQRLSLVAAGQIRSSSRLGLAERLGRIHAGLAEVIRDHGPQEAAVEEIFYAKNVRSAIQLGHARGVALLAASEAGLPVFAYPATVIKKAVVGYGQASKHQVQTMVERLLGASLGLSLDTSDALAAAICHLHHGPSRQG